MRSLSDINCNKNVFACKVRCLIKANVCTPLFGIPMKCRVWKQLCATKRHFSRVKTWINYLLLIRYNINRFLLKFGWEKFHFQKTYKGVKSTQRFIFLRTIKWSKGLGDQKNLSPHSSFFTLRLVNCNHKKKVKRFFKTKNNFELKIHNFLFAITLGSWDHVHLFSLFSTSFPCLSMKISWANSFTNNIHWRVSGTKKETFLGSSIALLNYFTK